MRRPQPYSRVKSAASRACSAAITSSSADPGFACAGHTAHIAAALNIAATTMIRRIVIPPWASPAFPAREYTP